PSSNWCSYVVTRTVSCHIQNGTFLQKVLQSCRWPLGCGGGSSYRTIVRPSYRVTYKTVTALEWRCCPGHTGATCEEGGTGHGRGMGPHPALVRSTGWVGWWGVPPTPPPVCPPRFAPAGCLNCSRVGELTARLATLEAQVAKLSVVEAPTSSAPKGSALGRGPETGQLWGSPAARGSPGDAGEAGSCPPPSPPCPVTLAAVAEPSLKKSTWPRVSPLAPQWCHGEGVPPPKCWGRGVPPSRAALSPGGVTPSAQPPLPMPGWGDGVQSSPCNRSGGKAVLGLQGGLRTLPGQRCGTVPPPPWVPPPHSLPWCHRESGGAGRWGHQCPLHPPPGEVTRGHVGVRAPPHPAPSSPQGEGLHQLREALKILAERVLILETMIGLY
ncbi:EMID1 protein, partial [Todus mexicanus]|nr:EMID1 protein [Todus mexicanus]